MEPSPREHGIGPAGPRTRRRGRARRHRQLALIESGELGGVIVVRVDRFARTVAEGAPMIHRIETAGGLFAAVDVAMDTNTPHGRYLLNLYLNNAELDLNLLEAGWALESPRYPPGRPHWPHACCEARSPLAHGAPWPRRPLR